MLVIWLGSYKASKVWRLTNPGAILWARPFPSSLALACSKKPDFAQWWVKTAIMAAPHNVQWRHIYLRWVYQRKVGAVNRFVIYSKVYLQQIVSYNVDRFNSANYHVNNISSLGSFNFDHRPTKQAYRRHFNISWLFEKERCIWSDTQRTSQIHRLVWPR